MDATRREQTGTGGEHGSRETRWSSFRNQAGGSARLPFRPRACERAGPVSTIVEPNAGQASGTHIRALIVDDAPEARAQMATWLKQQDDVLVTALPFADALVQVEDTDFDLILLGRNADQVLRADLVDKARKRNARVVIAVIGGSGAAPEHRRGP